MSPAASLVISSPHLERAGDVSCFGKSFEAHEFRMQKGGVLLFIEATVVAKKVMTVGMS